jgi:hypothetical protein
MIPHAWSNKTALKFGNIPETLINPPPEPEVEVIQTWPKEWKWVGFGFLIVFFVVFS